MAIARLLGLGLGLAALPALAQSTPAPAAAPAQPQQQRPAGPAELLIGLDANNDMAIDPGEVPESARDAFARLLELGDQDDDGKLGPDEVRGLLENVRRLAPAAEPAQARRRFQQADKDGDGKVTRDEFPGAPERFDRLDADRDGSLTVDEATRGPGRPSPFPAEPTKPADPGPAKPAAQPEPAKARAKAQVADRLRRLARLDKDGDGKITRDEYQGPAPLFDRLDKDGDGSIGRDELPRPPATPKKGQARPAGAMADRLKAMDTDGDGKLTRAEYQGNAKLFDRLDADSDGTLTGDELRSAAKRLMNRTAKKKDEAPPKP